MGWDGNASLSTHDLPIRPPQPKSYDFFMADKIVALSNNMHIVQCVGQLCCPKDNRELCKFDYELTHERKLRDVIKAGKVFWKEYRIPEGLTKKQL